MLSIKKKYLRTNHKDLMGYWPTSLDPSSACAQSICYNWLRNKCKLSEDACKGRHFCRTQEESERRDRLQSLQADQRRTQTHDPGDPFAHSDKQRHSARANIFASWLVEKLGTAFLGSGSGVVDVAGGKGALSFVLSCDHSLATTLIEPR